MKRVSFQIVIDEPTEETIIELKEIMTALTPLLWD